MIGLPGETDADVLGIAETCRMLQERCRDLGRLSLNITISNFTPKPHTPFQWHSVSTAEFIRRQQLLRDAGRRLRGVRFNFTDVRLSAMEDFIGRGDRRLAPVIEAAWRAGAGMDAWFEALDRTYEAWTGAIAAAGLDGRYRQMELGGWAAVAALEREDLKGFCAQPLPWDHIDSGIDKAWLAEDLQQALAATVVPDCSFEGCSSCGVCGSDLGHNVVVPPPPVPGAVAQQAPPSERVCRLRFRFSKTGAMALLSHLDLVRLLERALRRSELPVSFTGGFHPLPRLQLALALPLGVEAEGEWMDLEFLEPMPPAEVMERWQKALPPGLRLLEVQEVPVSSPKLSQQLQASRWRFVLSGTLNAPSDGGSLWQQAIRDLLDLRELIWEDTDKKGRPRRRDMRGLLQSLSLVELIADNPAAEPCAAELELIAAIDSQGRSLKPAQLQSWLACQLGFELSLSRVRRMELTLLQC